MKMKRFFWGAFGLLALTSCSNDELTSVNRDGDEIAFNVVTNSVSRAENVFCNNNKPTEFMVWATYNSATYINGDKIELQGENTDKKWVNTSGTRYWPASGNVTFYAHHNAGDFNWNATSPTTPTVNFTVEDQVANQKDFIYAVKTQAKPTSGGQVDLNFRHALSQIVFQAKNTNPKLYVEIDGVSVCNVKGVGKFTFPSANTDNNLADFTNEGATTNHDGTFELEGFTYDGSWGEWTIADDASLKRYDVTFDAVELGKKADNTSNIGTPESLTNNVDANEFNTNAMLLLPQGETTAWDLTSAGLGTGTYFRVKCLIYNVSGSKIDKTKDVCLWGDNSTGSYVAKDVAIPVTLKWEQGKKYIYTFVFGEGNGGYDPDPDTPKPVLVPITFNVTIDDFITEEPEDIKMDKPETAN